MLRKILISLLFIITSCSSVSNKINSDLKKLEFHHYQEFLTSMNKFTDSFNVHQKLDLFLPFNDSYRISNFCYVFAHCKDVPGLKINRLNWEQKKDLYQILINAYGALGYHQIVDIINRELILEEMELAARRSPLYKAKDGPNNKNWQPPLKRSHDLYNIAIFNDMKSDDIWALRFEVHHLLLNLTFKKEDEKVFVSATPTFMGASPAIIPELPKNLDKYYPRWSKEQVQQLLYEDSLLAKKIIKSFDKKSQRQSKLAKIAGATLVGGGKVYLNHQEFAGGKSPHISYSNLSEESKLYLKEFLAKIFARQRTDFLDIDNFYKSLKNAKIAFAGSLDDDEEFYIRVQTSRFLFELLQTSNYSIESKIKANHIHSILRDLKSDFYFDILQKHLSHYH